MGALYRHEPVCGSYCDGPRMKYRADGDWVRVEDFETAEKQRDDALAEIDRLREVVRQVHGLAEAAVRGTAVGAWLQTQEIHKITKGMVE